MRSGKRLATRRRNDGGKKRRRCVKGACEPSNIILKYIWDIPPYRTSLSSGHSQFSNCPAAYLGPVFAMLSQHNFIASLLDLDHSSRIHAVHHMYILIQIVICNVLVSPFIICSVPSNYYLSSNIQLRTYNMIHVVCRHQAATANILNKYSRGFGQEQHQCTERGCRGEDIRRTNNTERKKYNSFWAKTRN